MMKIFKIIKFNLTSIYHLPELYIIGMFHTKGFRRLMYCLQAYKKRLFWLKSDLKKYFKGQDPTTEYNYRREEDRKWIEYHIRLKNHQI